MIDVIGSILIFLFGIVVALILLAAILIIGSLIVLAGIVFYSKITNKENSATKFWDDICG